jgi:hypothetical protein
MKEPAESLPEWYLQWRGQRTSRWPSERVSTPDGDFTVGRAGEPQPLANGDAAPPDTNGVRNKLKKLKAKRKK